ncbi:MAG: hypothetical protein COC05_00010 [Gammaproteobacteria bacterium]|nr:MAG: hypothetical protein COC05_00010 [Gammaproteobacteria bacterium]
MIKRAQQLVGFSQFILLLFVMVPFDKIYNIGIPFYYALPISPAVGALRETMSGGAVVDWSDIILVYSNGLIYMIAGMSLFYLAATRARKKGNLGWY